MRRISSTLILMAIALAGCGPGLDTDPFHPGSVDGAMLWYKADQATVSAAGNAYSGTWTESLGTQTGLSLAGTGNAAIYFGSLGRTLLSFDASSYFSVSYPASPLSLSEFTVYAVMQGKPSLSGGVFGILSNNLTSADCASTNLSLRVTGSPGQVIGEFWNGSSSILSSIPASTGLSVVELRYGSDGTLRLQGAGQTSSASGPHQAVSISVSKIGVGAACSIMQGTPTLAFGNLNLGEVIFYNRAVNESESLRIRRYLMQRYGITQ